MFESRTLLVLFLTSLGTNPLFSEEIENFITATRINKVSKEDEGYTINFNNVSIVEYIRFVSKIFEVNFVFEEGDLQFNVTIVSEEPVSAKNVMSTLVQVFRAHQLYILEQENNLLITKSLEVNQLATVVNGPSPEENLQTALVTRVFRIKNANLATLVTILKPMMSKNALIEPSLETRQLIVTDITTNVEKIATLLVSLDAPHSPLEIDSYTAKYIAAEELTKLATELVKPFAEDNPLLITAQKDSSTIFIVSTPYLIDKTLAVMADLDTQEEPTGNVFVYKVEHRDPGDLHKGLLQIVAALQEQKNPPIRLINTLQQATVLKDSYSLLFTGDSDTLAKVKGILATLDTPYSLAGKATFLIYKIQHANKEQIENSLQQTADNLTLADNPDQALINAIRTMKWLPDTNSLFFTGDDKSLKQLQQLLADFDVFQVLGPSQQFFIYTPKYRSGEEIKAALQDIGSNLKTSGLNDSDLLHAIETVKWVPSTKSLVFTGSPQVLSRIQEILKIVDSSGTVEGAIEGGFFLYKLQYVQGNTVISQLDQFADHLAQIHSQANDALVHSIQTIKWIKDNNSLLFSGTPTANDALKELIAQIDIPGGGTLGKAFLREGATTFAIYTPQYQTGPELVLILKNFEDNLIQSGVLDRGLFDTINNLKWIDKTSSLLISGDLESIAKVEDLLHKFDVPDKGAASSSIETIESTNFLIYKLQYHQGGEIQSALKKIAADLQQPGSTASQNLLNTINSLQWIKITNSLLASGKQETLTKLKTLIENLDIPLRQVFIEVLVIQTTVDNSQNIGVQWGGKAQYLNKFGTGFNNIPTANPNSSTPGSPLVFLPNLGQISNTRFPNAVTDLPLGTAPFPGFDLGVIGDIIMNKGKSFLSLGALINALQQDGDSTIVMNPKIVAQDSNNSTIFVGQNIPFNSSIVTNSTANTLQTANIEYRDVGVNLSITPTIGTGNIITLDISNDISQQVSQSITISSSQGSIAGLQTTHTSMSTRVHIPDKHFLVLSGMVQDSTSHFKSSVPCLGGLPLIGAAFSNNERSRDKNNIVIFVRPQIINSTAEFDTITEHQEDVYRESAFLPSVQEAFDAGIDIVKQPLEETD